MSYSTKPPSKKPTETEGMVFDASTGNSQLGGSGSSGNSKDDQVHEHNTNTGNTRFDSSSDENAENGTGDGRSNYSVKFGSGQGSRTLSQGVTTAAFNAYKAPNPDPLGFYAEAQRNLEKKQELRGVTTHYQRPVRRQPYESGTGFGGVPHGLGSQYQPRHLVQNHASKGLELDFGVSERRELNGAGKRPTFFSPSRSRSAAEKDGLHTSENRHRQPLGHGNYRQASIETESEEDGGRIAYEFARQSSPVKNRVAGQSQKRALEELEEDDDDDISETAAAVEEEELFVHPKGSGPFYRSSARRGPKMARQASTQGIRQFEAVDISSEDGYSQDHDPAYFANAGALLNKARNSGVALPWASNRTPPANQPKVAGVAALLKRGVDPKSDKKVLKRASGANDPENITIVNMRDINKMRFEEIAAYLNDERIKKGLNPSLTTCGVNGRYNRTAPVLYRAQGINFVPPAERRRLQKAGFAEGNDGPAQVAQVWTPEMDIQLVLASKEYDEEKWSAVADMIEERMGVKVDETQCAVRFTTL